METIFCHDFNLKFTKSKNLQNTVGLYPGTSSRIGDIFSTELYNTKCKSWLYVSLISFSGSFQGAIWDFRFAFKEFLVVKL